MHYIKKRSDIMILATYQCNDYLTHENRNYETLKKVLSIPEG